MTLNTRLLIDGLKKHNISLSDRQLADFKTYAAMLVERNKSTNLTAITDPDGIAVKHFTDSVLPLGFVDIPKGSKLVDIGAGAGFPSVPLKIMRRDMNMTLLDGLNKRLLFLNAVAERLEMELTAVHMRAEDAGRDVAFRGKFDFAAARAVASLPELLEYAIPLLKVDGVFLAYKGYDCEAEINGARNAFAELDCKLEKVFKAELIDGSGRSVLLIRKTAETPERYPRHGSKITKKPL